MPVHRQADDNPNKQSGRATSPPDGSRLMKDRLEIVGEREVVDDGKNIKSGQLLASRLLDNAFILGVTSR